MKKFLEIFYWRLLGRLLFFRKTLVILNPFIRDEVSRSLAVDILNLGILKTESEIEFLTSK